MVDASALMTTAPPGVGGDTLLTAKTAYNNALVKLNNQRQDTLRNYGYTANFDPTTGAMSGLNVDPSNPYGQLQTTLRSQALEGMQATDNAVGRGIHGGLANQAQTDLSYAHHGQTSQLASNLMGTMDDYSGQQAAAGEQYNNTLYQAQLDASRNAILQQMFNTPDYSGLNYDAYNDPNTPPDPNQYGISDTGLNDLQNWKPPTSKQMGLGGSTPAKAKVVAKVMASQPRSENSASQNKVNAVNAAKAKKK